jgi:hypothetical protein
VLVYARKCKISTKKMKKKMLLAFQVAKTKYVWAIQVQILNGLH